MRKEITVTYLKKVTETGNGNGIRMSSYQIARLFGVYEATVITNVKAIIKRGVIIPNTYGSLVQSGKSFLPEFYDLEMIIALAFRINSMETAELRKWVMGKMISRNDNRLIVLGMNNFQLN